MPRSPRAQGRREHRARPGPPRQASLEPRRASPTRGPQSRSSPRASRSCAVKERKRGTRRAKRTRDGPERGHREAPSRAGRREEEGNPLRECRRLPRVPRPRLGSSSAARAPRCRRSWTTPALPLPWRRKRPQLGAVPRPGPPAPARPARNPGAPAWGAPARPCSSPSSLLAAGGRSGASGGRGRVSSRPPRRGRPPPARGGAARRRGTFRGNPRRAAPTAFPRRGRLQPVLRVGVTARGCGRPAPAATRGGGRGGCG